MHAIAGPSPGDPLRGRGFHYSAADPGRDGPLEDETLGTYADVHAEGGAFDRVRRRGARGGGRGARRGRRYDRRYHD